ncbi:PAS domain-containing sensor histidine kinase [Muriicola jejuensis]|uniref:histidine kinase n=1 Tax=Muriicola jejuensis TaxID=504488 RepID=A0A6P0UD78_9FLAO|nr:PAS domain S-box protein [Muriicola jejuensis]NER09233.1 PAS domain S-box protein [Muriicola jejuensis]
MLRGTPTVTFDYLVKQLPTATAFINKKYEVVYVSDKWINDFDFVRKDAIGASLKDLFGTISKDWEKVLKQCLKGNPSQQSLHHTLDQEGNLRWFEWQNIPWYDEKENIIGVILHTEDVSERILAEIQSSKIETLLEAKSEITNIGSWEFDVERNRLSWCEITKKLHEVVPTYEPNIDTAISFYKEGYSRNAMAMAVDRAIQNGEPYELTCELITAKNHEITVIATGKPIFKKGKLIGLVGTFRDITPTLENEKQVKRQERHFKGIFNSSYQFTGILDTQGTFLEVNETALTFSGLKEEEVIGKKFWDAYWWPIPDYIKDGLKQVVKTAAAGEFMRSEIVVLDKDKNPIPVDFSIKPIYDENQKIISLLAEGRMIKEMVAARRKLKESEQKFRALYELSPSSYILSDFDTGEILDFNTSFEQTTGYTRDHLGQLKVQDILVTGSRTQLLRIKKEIENNQAFGPEEQEYVKKDGTKFPVLVSGSLVGNKKGRKLLWSTAQDISESKGIEAQLREEKKLLRTLIDNLPLNVFIKDLDSKKVLVNKSELDYVGLNEKDVIGKNDFDFYDKESAEISRKEDLEVIQNLKPMLRKETISVKKDGTVTSFLTSKIPLLGEDKKVKGLIGISLDISDLKRKEEELHDLINVTSVQNKKLVNFAHIVSHNLRSHTANFSMLLDFLVSETDVEEKNKIIKMLMEASDNLLETLENLNEVVAISTNINLDKKPVNLCEKIKAVEQNLTAYLKNNNALIINDVQEDLEIKAVPAYAESILMNFITNAIKYRDPMRKPVIRLSAESQGEYTVLLIKDNGLGIDLDEHGDKLFGMYKTFHKNPEARGIGLYITKNQIEAMNGKIKVESVVGKGTTFKIFFNEQN